MKKFSVLFLLILSLTSTTQAMRRSWIRTSPPYCNICKCVTRCLCKTLTMIACPYFTFAKDKSSAENTDSDTPDAINCCPKASEHPSLHKIIKSNCISCLQTKLNDPEMNLDIINEHGITPLHLAAIYGHDEQLTLLIKAHADINAPVLGETYTHYTPLCLAIVNKKISTIEILLQHEARLENEHINAFNVALLSEINLEELVENSNIHPIPPTHAQPSLSKQNSLGSWENIDHPDNKNN